MMDISFDPVITIGPIVVWCTLVVFAIIVMVRLNRELRRTDRLDARLEALQQQVELLKGSIIRNDSEG
jgi:hypothetical protein